MFAPRYLLAACGAAMFCWVVGPSPVRANDDTPIRRAAAQLINVGWREGFAPRAELDRLYQAAREQHGAHFALHYGYALGLVKQFRYAEAAEPLDAAIALADDDLGARQVRIRVRMMLKQYDRALLELEELAARLPAAPTGDERRDAARFIGRMLGYLAGPAEGAVAPGAFAQRVRGIEAKLNDELLAAVDDARALVAEQWQAFSEGREQQQRDDNDKARLEREQLAKDVEEKRTAAVDRRRELEERRDKLRGDLQGEIDGLAAQDGPLMQQFLALERQSIIPRRELALLLTDIARLEQQAADTENPVERDLLLRRAQQFRFLAVRYERDLAVLDREARNVNAQRAVLERKRQEALARHAADQQRIEQQLADVTKTERQVAAGERRLVQPVAGASTAVRAISARATALASYDDFALERERQRLLAPPR